MATINAPFLSVKQGDRNFILTRLPASALTKISYAAVRGQIDESGAIQRILNSGRISSIKDFALSVGDFPNAIILNWVKKENKLLKKDGEISFKDLDRSAQIIDGQHRVAGIREAIKTNAIIGKLQLPVAIYENLSTRECADIFLSINTEQKTVSKSLVYDLYGEASTTVIDPAALRARDIASYLNSVEESPYFENIKFPGDKIRKGGIALSTTVTALKPLVEDKGDFDRIGISELELQSKVLINFFTALANKYGKDWGSNSNAFQYASGFIGAIDFLRLKVIPECNQHRSFEIDKIADSITLNSGDLILQSEVKGIGGKDAPKIIYERLCNAFTPQKASNSQFKI